MKKPTIIDIAEKAGVSKATVSMVLNNKDDSISKETREKIIKITKEIGYIPNSVARSLSTKKSGTIGIIVPDIINPFFSQIARAIEDAASTLKYNVIFCNTDNDEKKEKMYIKLLISKLVDGVILISGGKSSTNPAILKVNNIPFILVDRYIEGFEEELGVYCKNRQGVIDGIKYLYSKGKKNIVFVSGPKKLNLAKERLEGYIQIMKEYDLYDPKNIFESNFDLQGGVETTEEIIDRLKDRVDAIFYSNDAMALGGMKVLAKKGYNIPKDIAIMGFDNIQMSEFVEPELTTMGQPIYEMGSTACRNLVKYINGEKVEKKIYFLPKLILRGTV